MGGGDNGCGKVGGSCQCVIKKGRLIVKVHNMQPSIAVSCFLME